MKLFKIPFTGKTLHLSKNHNPGNFPMSFSVTSSWISNNPRAYIEKGYKLNAHLYSIVSRIARIGSKAKWQLFDVTGDDPVEIFTDPALDLVNNPNSYQSRAEWIECALAYKLLLGERTILKAMPLNGVNAGKTVSLHHIPPPMIDIKFDRFGEPILFKWGIRGDQDIIQPENMIYSKYWNPISSGLMGSHVNVNQRGLSPMEAGRRVLTQSNDVYQAGASLLKNLGSPGMMTLDDEDVDMDQPKIDDAQGRFQEKFAGAGEIMKMWFTNVKWKYTKISQSSKEIGLNDAHISTLRDMCNIYGTFSQLFNDPANKAYNSIREGRKDLTANVVMPELESLAGDLSRTLLPKGQEFRVDTSVFPELAQDMAELSKILQGAWEMTPNEKRIARGQAAMDDPAMDKIYMPTSLMELDGDSVEALEKLLKQHD